jgi:protein tyrosine/serine phosphatase
MISLLDWAGCGNVRDLGGLPTVDGGMTRHGALVRADSLDQLRTPGLAALQAYAVRRIVDLRSVEEAAARPVNLPGYLLRPLIDPSAESRRDVEAESTLAHVYRASLSRNAANIVAAVTAIADAPDGPVVVMCSAGKDRTGMVVALTLRVAGVTDDAIAADYAATAACLAARFEAELAVVDDDARERMRRWQSSEPTTILAMLSHLDTDHGGAVAYLRRHGMPEETTIRLRERLRGPVR